MTTHTPTAGAGLALPSYERPAGVHPPLRGRGTMLLQPGDGE